MLGACASEGQLTNDVKVYKSDGSLQCEGGGIPLEAMEEELTEVGINVFCAQKANDGMARITVCGADTGNINVYTIDRADLPAAEALGFGPVAELPEYRDEACSEFRDGEATGE